MVLLSFILIMQVFAVSGKLTLTRLAKRLDGIENDLQTEIEFRREDVKHLDEMIDELRNEKDIKAKPEVNLSRAGETEIDVLHRAFADEKVLSRKTRAMVFDLKQSVDHLQDVHEANISHGLSALNSRLASVEQILEQNNESLSTLLKQYMTISKTVDDILAESKAANHKFTSCKEIYDSGHNVSGVYDVYPESRPSAMRVYCDQETDGGGWTVFQRRDDGAEQFFRNWLDYKHGFGNLEGEFWIGNDFFHQLTRQCCHELRIDMEDFNGVHKFAKFTKFQIGTNVQNYSLTVAGYSGDAGDSFSGHNGAMFSTKDRDNDIYITSSCAEAYKGAWWYTKCHGSNLNGRYLAGSHESFADGVNWKAWKGYHYSLKYVEMKLR